jgi:hypothetical protein
MTGALRIHVCDQSQSFGDSRTRNASPNSSKTAQRPRPEPAMMCGRGRGVRRPTAHWLRQAVMNSAKAARPCSCHACTTSIVTTDLEVAWLRGDGDNLACLATTICLVLALLCAVQQVYTSWWAKQAHPAHRRGLSVPARTRAAALRALRADGELLQRCSSKSLIPRKGTSG